MPPRSDVARPVVGICVPTVREDAARAFVREWAPHWAADQAHDVRLFIHEDRPSATFDLGVTDPLPCRHSSYADIDHALGGDGWIIPRGSGACRSFPMWLAWKAGCEYVITLDDDCYPHADDGADFIAAHLRSFRQDRWFRTIGGDDPRGVPYERLGELPVRLNHGLWSNVPDLDGATALVRIREPRAVHLPRGHTVVPPGMAFSLCAMNVCYHRSILPAAYNLLMGMESAGFDRFDDIWSGLLLKRVLDYKGWYATSGDPIVRHAKRSNAFANLRKEAAGMEVHEHLWEYILDAPLPPGLDVAGAYLALAQHLRAFPSHAPAAPGPPGYFDRLADAMGIWARLC
jgi:hypothetical protein